MKIRRTPIFLLCLFGLALAPLGTYAEVPSSAQLGPEAVVSMIFYRLDCDRDGSIEASEVDDHFAQVWHPIDLDRSLSLSRREYLRTHRPVPDPVAEALFLDADANSSGKVSASEFRKHLRRMIKAADINKDGEVMRAEVGLKTLPQPKQRNMVARELPQEDT